MIFLIGPRAPKARQIKRERARRFLRQTAVPASLMQSRHLIAAIVGLAAAVTAAAIAPLDGYNVVVNSAEYAVKPGGPYVLLNGTVQEARLQLLKLNPNWDTEFAKELSLRAEKPHDREYAADIWESSKVDCGHPKGYGDNSFIKDGVNYLTGLHARHPRLPAGPKNCGQVSCSWSSAIWWCNDNKKPIELQSFAVIAEGARRIGNQCSFDSPKDGYIGGQVFHASNINVIVGQSVC
ncbi:restless-like transposase [Purpureocillium lavendulum]|uniref:Restless-like transposase n=1 Tax=Purpureocillium lavendulum TaxID=1247861 RepID=A0AB34FDU5_9HYPO|nr:restless-like transposase [Purpureocillium lavendulum]